MNRRSIAALLFSWLAISFSPSTVAVTPSPVPQSATQSSEPVREDKAPSSLFDDPAQQQNAHVVVRVNVPHKDRAVDTFAVHPYPMKPPVLKKMIDMVPEDEKTLKGLLLSTGYALRAHPDKPYPVGGWRWQYAYREAVRKSHLGVPHTIFGAYQWIKQIMPYAQREVIATNMAETERFQRYQKAVEEFDKKRVEVENDAVSKGLYPLDLRGRRPGQCEGNVAAGNWWLTCTRKAPGITYYWQVPFSAAPGENVNLTLTQPNALIVTGGW